MNRATFDEQTAAMHAELQAMADAIKKRNENFRQSFPEVFEPSYAPGVSAYKGCVRCGGTPDGVDSRGGFVGTCCCKGKA